MSEDCKGGLGARGSVPEDEVAHHLLEPTRRQLESSSQACTPECRKQSGSAASNRQKVALAREADPNGGICLFTRRSAAVEVCHLIPTAIDDDTLTRLERAWGYETLNVDTRYNLFFLRSDWHILFDQGDLMLIPQMSDLETMEAITFGDPAGGDSQATMNTVWNDRTSFEYHLLPMDHFKEPLCRSLGPEGGATHDMHYPPFPNLGVLTSHVRPNFVVVDTAQKIYPSDTMYLNALARHFRKITHVTNTDVGDRLTSLAALYLHWTGAKHIPFERRPFPVCSTRGSSHPPSNRDRDRDLPKSTRENQGDRPDGQQQSGYTQPQNPSPEDAPHQDAEDLDSEDGTVIRESTSDDTAWIEGISGWAKGCAEAASEGGWEHRLFS